MLASRVLGDALLERFDLGAEDEVLRLDDAGDRRVDLAANRVVLGLQIEERDGGAHEASSGASSSRSRHRSTFGSTSR